MKPTAPTTTPATPYAPDPTLDTQPAVQALPEPVRQHLWHAVQLLRAAGITVRAVKPQAYALSLVLYRYELLDEERARVALVYNGQLRWTTSLPQGPATELQQHGLACAGAGSRQAGSRPPAPTTPPASRRQAGHLRTYSSLFIS